MIVMGIFSGIKNRFRKEPDLDYDDIKSHVTGEPRPPPEMEFQARKFGDEPPRDPFGDEPLNRPEPFSRDPFSASREPVGFQEPQRVSGRDYDIMDKLSMIEAQLSAIRSQTETINERLKNLEMKITGRRY
jgi:hypothetical protein